MVGAQTLEENEKDVAATLAASKDCRISELENRVVELEDRVAMLEALNRPLSRTASNTAAFSKDCQVSSVIVDGKNELDAAWYCRHIAADTVGGLYITDEKNHVVRHIDLGGKDTAIAGHGGGGFKDGRAAEAAFHYPNGVAVGRDGSLYIADHNNHVMRKVSFEVHVATVAGNQSYTGYKDGQGQNAHFASPHSCAVSRDGDVYISDRTNHRIRRMSRHGTVTTIAGSGNEGFTNGQGMFAQFRYPLGIAVDDNNNVFVADSGNHVIRRIASDGTVKTYAGSGTSGFIDGTCGDAQFNNPLDVAVDSDGMVYVTDTNNHAIRCIFPTGTVTTIAGTGHAGCSDGTGADAQFSDPQGITLGTDGCLYVMDRENKRIRKISRNGTGVSDRK
eukprot:GEMP01016972.1.p1 GENE.GEMP01016972.1~~GEMP01016972.1.p1  ORF type:complete len:390 (+),score=91.65 GEMP01016972.1:94-1263(+)